MASVIVVPGPAVGAARPRVTTTADGRSLTYIPANAKKWETHCAILARQAHRGPPIAGAVAVSVEVWVSRPKRLRGQRGDRQVRMATGKPDLDNVVKLAMDALVRGLVLKDDTLVAELTARRHWLGIDDDGSDIGSPRVEVSWSTLEEGT